MFKEIAEICKLDLISNMVVEIPKLQGYIGCYYAKKLGINNTLSNPTTLSNLNEGESLFLGKKEIVTYGVVKNQILNSFNIDQQVFYAEFNWDTIVSIVSNKAIHVNEIPKYPEITRDLSMLLDENIDFESIFNCCIKVDKKLIKEVSLFDVYQ